MVASRLFISNFKKRNLPWAFFLALEICFLVETAFRMIEPTLLIPYADGVPEYYAATAYLDKFGPAEICIVGSSRSREGIVLPEIRQSLMKELSQPITVANYSAGGARADENRALVEYILRTGHPKLILYGVTKREFLGTEPRLARSAIFWSLSDWWKHFRQHRNAALDVLPVVIRNEISKHYLTVKYRLKPTVVVDDAIQTFKLARQRVRPFSIRAVLAGEVTPCPMRGEFTARQLYDPDRSLVNTPISDEHVEKYVASHLTKGVYLMGSNRDEEIIILIKACQRSSTPLILFEVPISDILKKHLPDGTYEEFLRRMRRIAKSTHTPFLAAEDLGITFSDEDFAEQSHLNLRGADRLTQALLNKAIVPYLKSTSAPTHRVAGNKQN